IKAMVGQGIRFSDIWEVASTDAVKADPTRYSEFRPVYVYAGTGDVYPGSGRKTELTYLKLKPGMDLAAAFLETRRYAGYLGATTEFTKMEGQAYNAADRKLYTVISYIRAGMIDGLNKDRPGDDIRLFGDEKDLTCGAIYESRLTGGQRDTSGVPIAS